MENPIHYSGHISKDIFLQAQKIHGGWMQRCLPYIVPLVLMLMWGNGGPAPEDIAHKIPQLRLLAPIAILFGFVLAFTQKFQLRRYYNKNVAYFQTPLTGEVDENRYFCRAPEGESNIPWGSFTHAKKGTGIVLLYRSPQIFNVLHKSFFSSEQDWIDAYNLVEKNFPKKR